ncbi:NUDIX domain-containing protein [Candidatus Dojkabacteria bacterium]|nr:NUDIX domain-containing protein [Candidatus Dojkabacteria bacterium]
MSKRTDLPQIASYILLEKDNKILLIRRYNTGWHDGDFTLPAGHVKSGESALQTSIREAKEEIGVTIIPEDTELAHIIHRNKEPDNPEYIDFYFKVKNWDGEIKLGESCDKCDWFELQKLPENIIPVVKTVLLRIKEGIKYSEDGWR